MLVRVIGVEQTEEWCGGQVTVCLEEVGLRRSSTSKMNTHLSTELDCLLRYAGISVDPTNLAQDWPDRRRNAMLFAIGKSLQPGMRNNAGARLKMFNSQVAIELTVASAPDAMARCGGDCVRRNGCLLNADDQLRQIVELGWPLALGLKANIFGRIEVFGYYNRAEPLGARALGNMLAVLKCIEQAQ